MKTRAPAILFCIVFLFAITLLKGQVAEDPITNVYTIGNSSEIFIGYSTAADEFTKQGILDIPSHLSDITSGDTPDQYKFIDELRTATAVGDFNADGRDDVVTIRDYLLGGIMINIPAIGDDLSMTLDCEYEIEELNTMDYDLVRICTGNFDRDKNDEFAVCYGKTNETLRVMLFEVNEEGEIELMDVFQEIVCLTPHFDIAAGDLSGDGLDEIALIRNRDYPYEANSGVNPPIFISRYDLYVLKYDTLSGDIEKTHETLNMEVENQQMPSNDWYYSTSNRQITAMRIACGDLDNNNVDEIVVGWSFYYSHYHNTYWEWFVTYHRYYWMDATFISTFDIGFPFSESNIEHVQNMTLGWCTFDQRKPYAAQRRAMSLKCTKLDNLGADEVLINGASTLHVLGSTGSGMELESKYQKLASNGLYYNVQGSEAFMVGDLNPDKDRLNFNKEVILLLSNQNTYNQYNNAPVVPAFEILSLDTISGDTVSFYPPGPEHDLPTGDSDVEISAMVAGDFDLEGADIFHVGTPDVHTVSGLKYPVVILNAPPIHFDVLEGVSHDLCNAYISSDPPTFTAVYNTRVGELSTTSVSVGSSMGVSSEFSAWAMAGGSGFESKSTQNFNKGQSFYKGVSSETVIEESKEAYTEDYVLYSNMDYTYYRYPIYDSDGSFLGNIAVLNPKSNDLKSSWGSGNSWDHPGYIFNHEPGNILSYKSCLNSYDFCSRPGDFSSCEFTRVPVSYTGNGSFSFSYENISDQGSEFSFSAGVGSDMFTKIGFEGTMTVNLGAFGIGGSIATDISVGVSSELSTYFENSQLSTHHTRLSDAFSVTGTVGRLDESYDNVARYYVTPYIYRSQSGALTLDYMVSFDESNMDWWNDNYGQKVDLAFILPWRHAIEKGAEQVKTSRLQKTSEIQFFPRLVSPGDTVCIAVRVHNYSLKDFENELEVHFYLGDPANDGIELTDIHGTNGVSKFSTMSHSAPDPALDFEDFLVFNWKVPDTLSCSPRIYAVIDQDNAYDEIHENNNTGWNLMNLAGCADCGYYDPYVEVEETAAEIFSFSCYPNPAKDYSRIRFSLKQQQRVTLEVYNLSGQLLRVVEDAAYPAGEHEVELRTDALGAGMYLYRFSAGGKVHTTKLLVL